MHLYMQKLLIVLSLVILVKSQNFGDLDHLGDAISASVANSLKPLEGLGSRINEQVQKSLRPMQSDLDSGLKGLDGLGSQISQSVYQGLEPVRAIELNLRMKAGVGGVTIVTHQPSGRQFIIKNNQLYTCDAQIDLNTGSCSGSLQRFKIVDKSDWCFINSYSVVNNQICLSTNGVSVQVIDNVVSCKSFQEQPLIQMTLDDYKNMCSSIRQRTEYRYIPDLHDQAHVAIPNGNKYVKCENREQNLCIFHENNGLLNTYVGSGGGISVQSNGGSIVF